VAKRLFDVVGGALMLAVAAPLMAAIVVAHKIEGRGPVFYRSPRLGGGGRVFERISFRTMVDADEAAPGARPADRQTKVGHFLRTYTLDDLPVLWNVLRGDMSLVGPRPTEPDRVDLADPAWQRILSVKPGLVSYAILRLGRTYRRSPMAARQHLELEYVARRSLRFDLAVFGAAVRALIASGGNIKSRGLPTA
jgi:lipopolysaccharide/colanic/teichoic acid biosynthesis glycosyltransferase